MKKENKIGLEVEKGHQEGDVNTKHSLNISQIKNDKSSVIALYGISVSNVIESHTQEIKCDGYKQGYF